MHTCESCGSALPKNAQFCGRCGRIIGSAMEGATTSRAAQQLDSPPPGASTIPGSVSNLQLKRDEEEELPGGNVLTNFPPPVFPVGGGQPLFGQVLMVQGTPALSQVPVVPGNLSVLGGASGVSNVTQGAASGNTPAGAAPSLSPPAQGASRMPLPQRGTTVARPAEPQPGRKSRVQGAARESLLSVPKWLLIAMACFILVAGSAGAFVAVFHVPLSGSGLPVGSPHAGGTTNVQGPTPHATACAGSNCTAATPTTAASHHTSLTVTFSGAVTGPLAPTSFGPCGSMKDSQGPYYAFSVQGTIQGKRYIFDIYVRPYHGPGTYTHVTTGGLTDETSIPSGSNGLWEVSNGTVTIASDGKSGTLDEALRGVPDPNGILSTPGPTHVSGSWTCA
jgi:hypothetical protein